jgi:hypothetical protein
MTRKERKGRDMYMCKEDNGRYGFEWEAVQSEAGFKIR